MLHRARLTAKSQGLEKWRGKKNQPQTRKHEQNIFLAMEKEGFPDSAGKFLI